MDMDEFMDQLSDYGNDNALWHEGIEVKVNGAPVVGFEFDGNTTLNLKLQGDDDL